MPEPIKRLYRSKEDRMIAGVIGGMAAYFEIDSSLLRLLTVAIGIFTGFVPLVIAYIIAWIIVPEEPA